MIKYFFKILILLPIISGCINTSNNKQLNGYDFELFQNTEVSELALAVEKQDINEIRSILKNKNLNIDFQEYKYGHTLLMLAVLNNLDKSANELLKQGADPNLRDKRLEESAFLISCSKNRYVCNTEIVREMLKHGAYVDSIKNIDEIEKNGMHSLVKASPLMLAAQDGCMETVKLLVENGANINQYTYHEGYGAITVSIIMGNLDITKYLIIDCKAEIPEYCDIRNEGTPKEKKLTITDKLNEGLYDPDSPNSRYRREIINYLKSKNLE